MVHTCVRVWCWWGENGLESWGTWAVIRAEVVAGSGCVIRLLQAARITSGKCIPYIVSLSVVKQHKVADTLDPQGHSARKWVGVEWRVPHWRMKRS